MGPDAAIDDAGDAAIAWLEPSGEGSGARAAVRPAATGAWLPSESISSAGASAEAPVAAFGGAGNLVVAWLGRPPGSPPSAARVESARRDAGTAAWSAPEPLSQAGAEELRLKTSLEGTVLASWRVGSPPDASYRTATLETGGGWSAPESLPAPQPPVLDVAIGPGGRLVAVGPAGSPDGRPRVMTAAERPQGEPWSPFPADLLRSGHAARAGRAGRR